MKQPEAEKSPRTPFFLSGSAGVPRLAPSAPSPVTGSLSGLGQRPAGRQGALGGRGAAPPGGARSLPRVPHCPPCPVSPHCPCSVTALPVPCPPTVPVQSLPSCVLCPVTALLLPSPVPCPTTVPVQSLPSRVLSLLHYCPHLSHVLFGHCPIPCHRLSCPHRCQQPLGRAAFGVS